MNNDPKKPAILAQFQSYIDSFRERYHTPALSVAVWYKDKLYQAASGLLNVETSVEATPDSIFQIASISKVFTASLIMQLVDEGRVKLDHPVKQYLRDFQLADSHLSDAITVAQLLDHTSGIPGDYVGDPSYTQPNALARYVDRCSLLGLVHAPGERYSYSNAAYNIAGRLIEVVLGITWYDAIEERIFKPLGMTHSVVHPSQVIRYRVAMGHELCSENQDGWRLTEQCYLPLSWAPCGAVMTLSAGDLIKFARVHLNGGRTDTGEQWLNSDSIHLMQQQRIDLPPPYSYMSGTGRGLGWQLTHTDSEILIGHSGGGMGQKSFLQVFPKRRFAIAALHNSNDANLLSDLLRELSAELADIDLPETTVAEHKPDQAKLESLSGVYETIAAEAEVHTGDGELVYHCLDKVLNKTTTGYLRWVEADSFISFLENGERTGNVTFLEKDEQGIPRYLYMSGRLAPRKGSH
jgi:CubicO group peptidase (beta-lactamase class C family)